MNNSSAVLLGSIDGPHRSGRYAANRHRSGPPSLAVRVFPFTVLLYSCSRHVDELRVSIVRFNAPVLFFCLLIKEDIGLAFHTARKCNARSKSWPIRCRFLSVADNKHELMAARDAIFVDLAFTALRSECKYPIKVGPHFQLKKQTV
jgi:hypothetical protein